MLERGVGTACLVPWASAVDGASSARDSASGAVRIRRDMYELLSDVGEQAPMRLRKPAITLRRDRRADRPASGSLGLYRPLSAKL
jgi:hypothetical protein